MYREHVSQLSEQTVSINKAQALRAIVAAGTISTLALINSRDTLAESQTEGFITNVGDHAQNITGTQFESAISNATLILEDGNKLEYPKIFSCPVEKCMSQGEPIELNAAPLVVPAEAEKLPPPKIFDCPVIVCAPHLITPEASK